MFQALRKNPFRKTILLSLLLGILILSVPQIAYGMGPLEWLGKQVVHTGTQVGNAIIKSIFTVLNGVASIFLGLATAFMQWTISDGFMGSLGYTPGNNFIIESGWTAMRNLANMFFILALVVIGIATALRYKEYQAQKALPRLIIVALLINFTPPILAFIINSFDTIMHSLLPSGFGNVVTSAFHALWEKGLGENFVIVVGKSVAIFLFNITAAIIFFLYGLVFMLRQIVLWMLIIISPLAFMGYIFPSTKQYVKQWWSQFIQWCSVGVILSLTIYLCNVMLGQTSKFGTVSLSQTATGQNLQIFESIIPYFIPLSFLVIGFLMAVKVNNAIPDITVQGAKAIGAGVAGVTAKGGKKVAELSRASEEDREEMSTAGKYASIATQKLQSGGGKLFSGAKKTGSKVSGWAGKPIPEKYKEPAKQKVKQGAQKAGKKVKEQTKFWGKKAAKGAAERIREEGGKPSEFLTRGLLSETEQTKQAENRADERTDEENADLLQNSMASMEDRAAALVDLTRKGNLEMARKEFGVEEDDVASAAQGAMKKGNVGQVKDIANSHPGLGWEIAKDASEEQRKRAGLDVSQEDIEEYFTGNEINRIGQKFSPEKAQEVLSKGALTAKLAANASSKDIENWSSDALEDENVMRGVHRSSPQTWSKLGKEFGREAVEKINNGLEKRGSAWYKSQGKENLLDYLDSSGARSIGLIKKDDVERRGTANKGAFVKGLIAKEKGGGTGRGTEYTGGGGPGTSSSSGKGGAGGRGTRYTGGSEPGSSSGSKENEGSKRGTEYTGGGGPGTDSES